MKEVKNLEDLMKIRFKKSMDLKSKKTKTTHKHHCGNNCPNCKCGK